MEKSVILLIGEEICVFADKWQNVDSCRNVYYYSWTEGCVLVLIGRKICIIVDEQRNVYLCC